MSKNILIISSSFSITALPIPIPSEIPEDITKTKEDTKKKFGLY